MIYSRWRSSQGGYDYFENSEMKGIGDDFSSPVLRQVSPIGVASLDAGRALPMNAKYVGSGLEARGSIVPISRSVLGSIQTMIPKEVLYFVAGIATYWFISRAKK